MAQTLIGRFRRHVLAHRGRCFLMLMLTFVGFGIGTVNLFMLLAANLRLIAEHGWIALGDGALWQLLQLSLTAGVSLAAYVIFKACEYRLVHDITEGEKPVPPCGRD